MTQGQSNCKNQLPHSKHDINFEALLGAILYLTGVWNPTLIGIALMFGCGNAFDTVVSGVAYWWYKRKKR